MEKLPYIVDVVGMKCKKKRAVPTCTLISFVFFMDKNRTKVIVIKINLFSFIEETWTKY